MKKHRVQRETTKVRSDFSCLFGLFCLCALSGAQSACAHTAFSQSVAGQYSLPWDLNRVQQGYWETMGFYPYAGPTTPLVIQIELPEKWMPNKRFHFFQLTNDTETGKKQLVADLRAQLMLALEASHRFNLQQTPSHLSLTWSLALDQSGDFDPELLFNPDAQQAQVGLITRLMDPQGQLIWKMNTAGLAQGPGAMERARRIAVNKAVAMLVQFAPRYTIEAPIVAVHEDEYTIDLDPHAVQRGDVLKAYYQPSPSADPALEPLDHNLSPQYVGDLKVIGSRDNKVLARRFTVARGMLAPHDRIQFEKQVPPSEWADDWSPLPILPLPF